MPRLFVDTSILIRFLTGDDPARFQESELLIQKIEDGEVRPYISGVVLGEVFYVLRKLYKFTFARVVDSLEKILSLRNLNLIERTDTREAVKLLKKYRIKFSDCLIATQIPKGVYLATYDDDFAKIATLKVVGPSEIISKM